MARKSTPGDPLFGMPKPDAMGPGPVYQGVCKQIREMIEAKQIDRDLDAGAIAASRSLAKSIDHAAGHNARGTVAAGMQIGALHQQLREWLAVLVPAQAEGDPWREFLEEVNGDSSTPTPHPEV